MCESFNNVLKEARDKPILTHMEWMRMYVMKRHFEKREIVKTLKGRVTPYVQKFLSWAVGEAYSCEVTPSNDEEFEVEYKGCTFVVDMKSSSCSCYHWQLTGLPCAHAIACIKDKRDNYFDYVDEAYTKARLAMAYEQCISPMPDATQWEKVGNVEPTPPPFRKLPGRPTLKKRRKEAGETSTSQSKKRKKEGGESSTQSKKPKMARCCGKCEKVGYNVKTCKNPPMEKVIKTATRPTVESEWSKKYRAKTCKKKDDNQRATTIVSATTPTVESEWSKKYRAIAYRKKSTTKVNHRNHHKVN